MQDNGDDDWALIRDSAGNVIGMTDLVGADEIALPDVKFDWSRGVWVCTCCGEVIDETDDNWQAVGGLAATLARGVEW